MSALNVTTERTYYDGQMPVEESVTTAGNTTLTRNFVGARGIEAMFLTQGGSTNTSYPLYDVHGNMVATVAKGSSGTSWTIQDERSYDVWGSVRSGAATGGPRGRYCANLGHVQDDESGLVYMRARYYEPGSGRFISEDSKMDGQHWYIYTSNEPSSRVDYSGKEDADETGFFRNNDVFLFATGVIGLMTIALGGPVESRIIAGAGLILLLAWVNLDGAGSLTKSESMISTHFHLGPVAILATAVGVPLSASNLSIFARVLSAIVTYATVIGLMTIAVLNEW